MVDFQFVAEGEIETPIHEAVVHEVREGDVPVEDVFGGDAELAFFVVEGRIVFFLFADHERGVVVQEELVEMVGSDHDQDVWLCGGERLTVRLDFAFPLVRLGHPFFRWRVVALR